VFNYQVESTQSLRDGNFLMQHQVVFVALENVVRLLFEHYDDVALSRVRQMMALATENDLLCMLHAFVDVNHNLLLLLDSLRAFASVAAVLLLDELAAAITVVALRRDLLRHEAHLMKNNFRAGASTLPALLDVLASAP